MYNDELKIMVPKGWVVNEEVRSDGSRVFTIKQDTVNTDDTIKQDTANTDETICHQRKGIHEGVPIFHISLEDGSLEMYSEDRYI